MSEADNPTNDSPDRTLAPVIVPASQRENPHVDYPAFSSWVETTENALAALAPSQRLDLIALIQQLRSSNSNLLNRANQLSQALSECQNELQSYKERSRVAESRLSQQTQELAAAQEQVRYLSHELEASCQNVQRQQILIETLTAQLESSQEQVTHLEQECSLIQNTYNQQSHTLVQAESTCEELRTRLKRQERHTLQFKVALEKCLEVPVPTYQSQVELEFPDTTTPQGDLRNAPHSSPSHPEIKRHTQSAFCVPKAQPIPSWSAQPEPTAALEIDSDISEAEDADWEDLVELLDAVEEPVTANSSDNSPQKAIDSNLGTVVETTNTNWPSPVVYPSRAPKGRKSLAAIELPTFSPTRNQRSRVRSQDSENPI